MTSLTMSPRLPGPVAAAGAERSGQLERGVVETLAGPQQGQQFVDQGLSPLDLGGRPVQGQLIAAQADIAPQQTLQGAQVSIVLADQERGHMIVQIDLLGGVCRAQERRSLTRRDASLPSTRTPP